MTLPIAPDASTAAHVPRLTLTVEGTRTLLTPDQTRLPFEHRLLRLSSARDCEQAIVLMQVRGAPLIGAVAAFGLAFAVALAPDDQGLDAAFDALLAARPTAVNLRWALRRVRARVLPCPIDQRAEAAWAEACAIYAQDIAINRAIGEHGATLLRERAQLRNDSGRPVTAQAPLQVLTHCNAGRLATVAYGTALAPIYTLHEAGVALHVWVDETRPRNQGASLTAWELADAGIPCTVVADNAGGWLMREGLVDAVIVGCDRVARNGDVANKIGTYLKALAARDAGVPFWVACPTPTIDPELSQGSLIPIEMRNADEVLTARGQDADGRILDVRLAPAGVAGLNPAFDVTPARLVDRLITQTGAWPASEQGVAQALLGAATE